MSFQKKSKSQNSITDFSIWYFFFHELILKNPFNIIKSLLVENKYSILIFSLLKIVKFIDLSFENSFKLALNDIVCKLATFLLKYK